MRILHWFRKDLRLDDNTALDAAARDAGGNVVPFYSSEPSILSRPDIAPIRVQFVLDALADLDKACRRAGSRLALAHGEAVDTVPAAARAAGADAVSWNDEYEPALIARDAAVEQALRAAGIGVRRSQDRLLVPPDVVMTREGKPYSVYSAFRRACEALPLPVPSPLAAVTRLAAHDLPERRIATVAELGFAAPPAQAAALWPGGATAGRKRLEHFLEHALARYATERDFPAAGAHSRLSADLKFGTLGVRRIAHAVLGTGRSASTDKYVAELRWRDFYAQVLFHHPHVEHGAFRREFDAIPWEGTEEWFQAWCAGRTGYPIVDAGMRELAATGFMHNRVRMIVASFLAKDLLTNWQRGERWFMQHLVDGDVANNNGGWQWAAGTGTDAQPYFRIFNPALQRARFDPVGAYVGRWSPPPDAAEIVVHEEMRARALAMYASHPLTS
ncbi:MAG: deoxyribodipyrimidine photo-lyase [Candidatus Eisenbacteria bacterium]